jgi:hypothetical protein
MHTSPFPFFYSQLLQLLAVQVPILLVCIVGIVVILGRWNEGSSGSIWALFGFGISLILCFAIPFGQTITQQLMVRSGVQAKDFAWAFTALALLWSVLRAVSYILLLVAVFAGRPNPQGITPSHLQKL